jgi:WXXGXW repeat (2 copies)
MTIRSIRTLWLGLVVLCMTAASFAQIGVAVRFGPPPLPVYEQPICPGDGFIWTPGYWAYDYDAADYYWVPGTWVLAPEVGFLWTPGYWGWGGGGFLFHEGFWGPRVGFYGGINYGFGYFGVGFEGGRWDNGHFFYNRAVSNVNVTVIHNVYNTTVVNRTETRVSFNGGDGGIQARPTPEQEAAEHERHMPPVADQTRHVQEARSNREQRASVNMGKPAIAASARPADFKGKDVVRAREAGGHYEPPANRGENQPNNRPENNRPENGARPSPVHPRDLPAAERPSAPNSGNQKADKKYQQQQEKQFTKQDQERQRLQQKQDKEDQRLSQQKANDGRKQQVEQRHQQQTQQLQQKHEQQQKQMQQKHQPAHPSEPKPPKN